MSRGAGGPAWPRDEAAWRRAFEALSSHYRQIASVHLRELFARDPDRAERYSLTLRGTAVGGEAGGEAGGEIGGGPGAAQQAELFIDYSKHRVTDETFELLLDLARASGVEEARDAMFAGERINITEDRPVQIGRAHV